MSILTNILLIAAGVALLILVLRSRPKTRVRRLEDWEKEKLERAAQICHAAARDAFDLSLDGSLASLDVLDHMIEIGWNAPIVTRGLSQDREEEADAREEASIGPIPDEQFVVGCYFGSVIVEHMEGQWRVDNTTHRWPYVYFSRADLAVSPFELAQRKFEDPEQFHLAEAARHLSADIERRTHVRATTWHTTGTDRVTFGGSQQQTNEQPTTAEQPSEQPE
jgi:hypothetical protein